MTLLIVLVDLDQTYATQILIVDGTGIVLRECVHQIVTVQLPETQRVQVKSSEGIPMYLLTVLNQT